jgi:Tol biopolymer transport system component
VVAQEFDSETLRLAREPIAVAQAVNDTPEGRLDVAASANGILSYGTTANVAQLSWVDRTGKRLGNVGEQSHTIYMFRLADERHLAVQLGNTGGSDLWLMDAEHGVLSRFTADSGSSIQPLWSPDSGWIVFTHLSTHDLVRRPANGVGEEENVAAEPLLAT